MRTDFKNKDFVFTEDNYLYLLIKVSEFINHFNLYRVLLDVTEFQSSIFSSGMMKLLLNIQNMGVKARKIRGSSSLVDFSIGS